MCCFSPFLSDAVDGSVLERSISVAMLEDFPPPLLPLPLLLPPLLSGLLLLSKKRARSRTEPLFLMAVDGDVVPGAGEEDVVFALSGSASAPPSTSSGSVEENKDNTEH